MENTNKIAVVIPSLEPDSNFIDYIKNIKEAGADYVVIVDDGNKPIYKDVIPKKEKKTTINQRLMYLKIFLYLFYLSN